MNPETTAFYKENIKISDQRIQELSRKSNILSLFRLLVIVGGAILIFQVVQTEDVLLTLSSFIVTVLLFLTLVLFQSKTTAKKKAVERFLHINKNELTVAEDIKQNVYDSGQSRVDDQHIYTSDLDIFGEGSIFQMINRCATLHGNALLSNWLSHPANAVEIEERQEFVQELSSDFPWWQDVQAKLYAVKGSALDVKKLISHYLVNEIQFPKSKILALYTKVTPFLFMLLFLLSFFQSSFISIIIFVAIFNLLLSIAHSSRVNLVSAGLNKGGEFLSSYIPALKKVEERAWESKQAQEMQKKIADI